MSVGTELAKEVQEIKRNWVPRSGDKNKENKENDKNEDKDKKGRNAFRGGASLDVVRGVCCEALSISRLPVFGAGSRPRCPCFPVAGGFWVGTHHRPRSVRPCEPALRTAGVARRRPREGCLAQL